MSGPGGIGAVGPGGLSKLGKQADLALGAMLLGIVALMIVPIPTQLLDVLLATNLALSTVLLLVSMSVRDGGSFAAMPTILLVTTLFRLALNVSSTRLILLQADAGRVIEAFGHFVVRGNYAVGGVVFLVLTLIQYVVVARGAERVAEVGARFTLDAMPGRQLAIDSDLRSGAIDVEEARTRRKTLDRESQLYGAMDGAMKFVKGDAIAGIVITLVNVIAGVGIGVGMRDLSAMQSLRTYGLLTIGDGLVCQIPSLLVATSAGLVVTRVASADGGTLGLDVARQLFGNRRVLAMAAGFLLLLALVPGLPAFPFAVLALMLGAASWGLWRAEGSGSAARAGEAAARALPPFSALGIALGSGASAALLGSSGVLANALEAQSEQLGARLGVRLPVVALRMDTALPPQGYALLVSELPIERGELDANAAADAGPAASSQKLAARLTALALRHPSEILGLPQTQRLLDELGKEHSALIRAVMPKPVSLALLCEVLRRLLAEGVTLRPLAHILETLGAEASREPSAARLAASVRMRLARHVTHALAPAGALAAHRVDPMIEDALRDGLRSGSDDEPALPPDQARDIVAAVRRSVKPGAVVLCQSDVRRALRALIEDELPEVPVLAYEELASDVTVEQRAAVKLG